MERFCRFQTGGFDWQAGKYRICGVSVATYPDDAPRTGRAWMKFIATKYCPEHAERVRRENDLRWHQMKRRDAREERRKLKAEAASKEEIIMRLKAENAALRERLKASRR